MENDPLANDDAYDFGVFEIDPETESAVDPEPAPLYTIYHNPRGGFTIPTPLPEDSYYFNHHFLKSNSPNLKQDRDRFLQTQEPETKSMICQNDHHPRIPILINPTFGKGTGLEEIRGAREAMMITPVCSLAKLKETLRHTFFENKYYQEGGNFKSGKEPLVPITGIEVKDISVKGLGVSMMVHEGNVEALLMMVGRKAPEMSLNVAFIKTA